MKNFFVNFSDALETKLSKTFYSLIILGLLFVAHALSIAGIYAINPDLVSDGFNLIFFIHWEYWVWLILLLSGGIFWVSFFLAHTKNVWKRERATIGLRYVFLSGLIYMMFTYTYYPFLTLGTSFIFIVLILSPASENIFDQIIKNRISNLGEMVPPAEKYNLFFYSIPYIVVIFILAKFLFIKLKYYEEAVLYNPDFWTEVCALVIYGLFLIFCIFLSKKIRVPHYLCYEIANILSEEKKKEQDGQQEVGKEIHTPTTFQEKKTGMAMEVLLENKVKFLVVFLVGCLLTIPVNSINRSNHILNVSYAAATSYAMGNALCEGQKHESAIVLGHAGEDLSRVYSERDYDFLFSSWANCKARRLTREAWSVDDRKEEALVILLLVSQEVFEDHIPFTKNIVENDQDNPRAYMETLVRRTFSTSLQKEYFQNVIDYTYSYTNIVLFFMIVQLLLNGSLYNFYLKNKLINK